MKCPKCNHNTSGVLDSRPRKTHISRRRKCDNCDHVFTTSEVIVVDTKGNRHVSYDQALTVENTKLKKDLLAVKNLIDKILKETNEKRK